MSAFLQLTVNTLEAASEDMQAQLVDNSMDLQLAQKHNSKEIEDIHARYAPEQERIRNEMKTLDKTEQNDEYQDLLAELKESKDAEEKEVERAENEIKEYETEVQAENTSVEARLEDAKTQKESFQEMLKQNIEQSFGYFQ